MTRIMLRFLLLLLGEGLILLSSGETTVSVVDDLIISTESKQPFSSEVENRSSSESGSLPTEDHLLSENATAEFDANRTSTEADAKTPIEPTAASAVGRRVTNPDSKDDDVVSEMKSMRASDPQNTTPETEEIVEGTEHSSVFHSVENETHYSEYSTAVAKDSMQKKTDAMTTHPPKSATRKRSPGWTTDGFESEGGTTAIYSLNTEGAAIQPSHDSDEAGSASSHSSEESFEIGTEAKGSSSAAGTAIPHRFDDLEREKTTILSKGVDDERESEFSAMAETEDYVKLLPPQGQSILPNPPVIIMGPQHGVLNGVGTKKPLHNHHQENNIGFSREENVGVTFDPDGMRHYGPQDPDSVLFSVPDDSREREFPSDEKNVEINDDEEREEVRIEKETNPDEGKNISDGIRKFEKLEHLNPESSAPEHQNVSAELPLKNTPQPIFFENAATLPEFQLHNNTGDEGTSETPRDAPHGVNVLPEFAQSKPEFPVTIHEDFGQTPDVFSTQTPADEPRGEDIGSSPSPAGVGSGSPHLPDQSVIRPVVVRISNTSEVTSSVSPGGSSSTSSVPPTVAAAAGGVVSPEQASSSPIAILPDNAVDYAEVSSTQPELVDSSPPRASAETLPRDGPSNSTIAVATSVSALTTNSTQGSQQSTNGNSSSVDLSIAEKESNVTSFPTTTPTESTGFKIRKPKLKIGGESSDAARATRPSFVPRRGATTEAGPPVSIFRKQRTRIASITSSTTARPFRPFSTIRVHYATHHGVAILPPAGEEWLVSTVPVTMMTEPTTTEEPIEEEPFTDQTVRPVVVDEAGTTLVKVAGYIAVDRGMRWHELLDNRQTPEYRDNARLVLSHLERLFRSSPIATRLWKIEIDGFSGSRKSRPVGVDFFLYLIKGGEESPVVAPEHLESIFRKRLSANRTFGTYRVDVDKTVFEVLLEEPLLKATPPPDEADDGAEPPIPQWAIACIVIGAASLIFIVLFAAVTLYGRHHMRRRYSSKLSEEEGERGSGEWESKMAAAYENMAADTLYDAEEENTYRKPHAGRLTTFHGIPSPLTRRDSWSDDGRPRRWTSHFD